MKITRLLNSALNRNDHRAVAWFTINEIGRELKSLGYKTSTKGSGAPTLIAEGKDKSKLYIVNSTGASDTVNLTYYRIDSKKNMEFLETYEIEKSKYNVKEFMEELKSKL